MRFAFALLAILGGGLLVVAVELAVEPTRASTQHAEHRQYVPSLTRSGPAAAPPTPTPTRTPTPEPTPTPSVQDYATPEDAMAAEAASMGYEYVGECPDTLVPGYDGKMCHKLLSGGANARSYLLGVYTTEAGLILTLEYRSGGWVITDREQPTFPDFSWGP